MEEDKYDLYIPMGLKEKNEYWDGFGKDEAIKTLITVGISTLIDVFIYFITKNIVLCSVVFLTSIGGSIMFFVKDTTNLSAYNQICNMINFAKSQKKYEYKSLDELK
ncbi:hypothetical protein [Sporanaerobacter acetigenes]|uniref:PrgI family protein n=1 Tax=Sporanaerobacter acetigenes DSM 13106 TaxID=1123281 RepID=A0A1M5U8G2_9FIRM|nr:hypothetical protein [Sporanaerobacter acetigenes]SHH59201.1 hypothetical protein SAMN02745180_00557 [Sporanaerobacter acetigenes DSM 13106]